MRLAVKLPSGYWVEVVTTSGNYSKVTGSFVKMLYPDNEPALERIEADALWITNEGFADYVGGSIEGVVEPKVLGASGEVNI